MLIGKSDEKEENEESEKIKGAGLEKRFEEEALKGGQEETKAAGYMTDFD
jgi:hypothetical protein